jgi:hypothetical protein
MHDWAVGRPVPDEVDQVGRLFRFRHDRPDVIIEADHRGVWHGRIPEPETGGETVTARYTLRELLDRLDELTSNGPGIAAAPAAS